MRGRTDLAQTGYPVHSTGTVHPGFELIVQIRQINISEIDVYEKIPMCLRVESVFGVEIVDQGLGGYRLTQRVVAEPWVKDYLALEHKALCHRG